MYPVTGANGKLPTSLLVVADTGPNGPQQLRTDAAASWAAMLAAGMPAGCLRSGYRTLTQQQREVSAAAAGLTPSALPAGQSQHGEGLAADVDEPARTWITTHGRPYGWIAGTAAREPWHMQYLANLDTHPAPPRTPPIDLEDTMKLIRISDDGRIFAVGNFTFDQIADMDHVNALLPLTGPWVDVDIVTAQRIHDVVNSHLVNLAASLKGQGL